MTPLAYTWLGRLLFSSYNDTHPEYIQYAILYLEKAITLDPLNTEAYYNTAIAYSYYYGKHPETIFAQCALDYALKGIDLGDKNYGALKNVGQYLYDLRRYCDAEAYFEAANPSGTYIAVFYYQALVAEALGQRQTARHYLDTFIQLKDTSNGEHMDIFQRKISALEDRLGQPPYTDGPKICETVPIPTP